ncbi:unnamed protein product [Cylicocyclus nassatus]|uniref:Uncharacterized protein n=1 Tax=Cylicocyclus nassatus TaxID=53992 RepID=A0AA36MGB4_CYLNA|nr:unnamed protein product [Cylicocyclus nassatus]
MDSDETHRINALCAVNFSVDDPFIKALEEKYTCAVFHSKTGLDCKDVRGIVFVFDDFENEIFHNFKRVHSEASVFGIALIKSRIQHNLCLPRAKPKRAVYCDMFRNINVIIGFGEEAERSSWSKLVRYMGGRVRKEPEADSTFLVTKEARGRTFRMLISLGQKVLLPTWLEECWSCRDDLGFDPTENALLRRHRIGVFESLKICVVGFEDDYASDIRDNISSFGATVVDDAMYATHVVVSGAHVLSRLPAANQRIVTAEWVWTSISIQYCANEDAYMPATLTSLLPASGEEASEFFGVSAPGRSCNLKGTLIPSGKDNALVLPESFLSPEKDAMPNATRAHHICIEMLETDISYANSLRLLVKVKSDLEHAIETGDPLMQKADVSLIFGKIPPILHVHEHIIATLRSILDNWDEASASIKIAQVWIGAYEDLDRVYSPYSNNYDTARITLTSADETDPRLHAFIRAKECGTDFQRCRFQDLLIKPVQRLPTVVILLKELQKRDANCSKKVDEAIALVEKIISRANTVRAQNDDFIEQISFFNEVECVPPYLVCSRRRLVKSVEGYSIGGTAEWNSLHRRKVKIVLYNDVILVCKVRNALEKTRALTKLTRHASFSNLAESKKQYKYFAHLFIPNVREINRLKFSSYEGSVDDRLEPTDILPIFGWTIRDVSSDSTWYVEAADKDLMVDFIEEVHKKIFMDFGRDISWPGFTISDVPSSNLREMLKKHIRRTLQKSEMFGTSDANCKSTVLQPFAFSSLGRRSAQGLRRTVSHLGSSFARLTHPFPFGHHSEFSALEESPERRVDVPEPCKSPNATHYTALNGGFADIPTRDIKVKVVKQENCSTEDFDEEN